MTHILNLINSSNVYCMVLFMLFWWLRTQSTSFAQHLLLIKLRFVPSYHLFLIVVIVICIFILVRIFSQSIFPKGTFTAMTHQAIIEFRMKKKKMRLLLQTIWHLIRGNEWIKDVLSYIFFLMLIGTFQCFMKINRNI